MLIKLHTYERGNPLYVNPAYIRYCIQYMPPKTKAQAGLYSNPGGVVFMAESESQRVREAPEDILNIIRRERSNYP